MRSQLIGLLAIFVMALGCTKEEKKKGPGLGAPLVEPPVTNNLPSSITSGLTLALDGDKVEASAASVMKTLKDYLKPTTGFVGPLERLQKIDQRMAELDSRSKEDGERSCMSETLKDFSLAGKMGDGTGFDLAFLCQENVSTPSSDIKESQVAFGLSSDTFYLMERTFSADGSGIAVMVKEPLTGTSNEIWEARYKSAANSSANGQEAVTWLHIKSEEGSVEVTTAANVISEGGTSCGMQMRTSTSFVYVKGSVMQAGVGCGEIAEYCVKADSLEEAELADCVGAGLNKLALTPMTPDLAKASLADAKAIAETSIAGYTDFNTEK